MPPSALDRAVVSMLSDEYEEGDLDKTIAEMILKEAREKNQGQQRSDLNGQLRGGGRRQVTNTRFLTNVVRGVQGHNRATLVANTAGERRDAERGESNQRQVMPLNPEDDRGKGKLRGWDDDEDGWGTNVVEEKGRGRHSESPDAKRRKRRDGQYTAAEEEERHRRRERRERHRDGPNSSSGSGRSRSRRSARREEDREESRSSRHRSERSPRSKHRIQTAARSGASSEGAGLAFDEPSSKMDRYFERGYDPRLDVSTETREDANGLIEDDGWDRMLGVLKEKEERRKAKKERASRKGGSRNEEDEEQGGQPRLGTGLMDTRYARRGGVREWDKGKET